MARVYKDKRTGWWCVDYRDATGRRRQNRVAMNRALAERMLRKCLDETTEEQISGGPGLKPIKFNDFTNDYLAYARANKRPSSVTRDGVSIKNLSETFGDKFLTEITVKDIEKYKSRRIEKAKPGTVNRELACLKTILNKAILWNHAKNNPVRQVKLFREDNQIVRFLSPEESKRLIAHCPAHLKPIVITALHTGMRRSEIYRLKWADVDGERKSIAVRESKNHEPRHIPMSATLIDTLQSITPQLRNPYVFRNREGHPYVDLKKSWHKTLKEAGIINFRFHDLRHSFASNIVMAGVDLNTVRELLGHKSIQMTLRYAHLSTAHKEKAVGQLDAYLTQNKGKDATYLQTGTED